MGNQSMLFLTDFNAKGRATVKLSERVTVILDQRHGYPKLYLRIYEGVGRRRDYNLISTRSRQYDRLQEHLDLASKYIAKDIMHGTGAHPAFEPAIKHFSDSYLFGDQDFFARFLAGQIRELFPVDQWLSCVFAGEQGPVQYTDRFSFDVDDGRSLALSPLNGKKQQAVEVWPGLRVILQDKDLFARLSVLIYYPGSKPVQTALSTSQAPSAYRASIQMAKTIDEYRNHLNPLPVELAGRLPIDQWITAMLEWNQQPKPAPAPVILGPDDDLLTICPTKNKPRADSMAKWVISPSVMLAYWERTDRPALYILKREDEDKRKLTHQRIGSVPLNCLSHLREELTSAVIEDCLRPGLNHGDLGQPLIDTCAIRKQKKPIEKVIMAVNQLPLHAMMTFYDQAIMPTRINGHGKPKYPLADPSLAWISFAAPSNLTATKKCWWVLVGKQADTMGKVFAWNGNSKKALMQAQRWRDEALGKYKQTMGINHDYA